MPTWPLRTPSCRPTCTSSRWRSGSACSSIVSDGITARYGTPFTPLHHFSPWNVDDDGAAVDSGAPASDEHTWASARVRSSTGSGQPGAVPAAACATSPPSTRAPTDWSKRIAKPHQYFAVTKAVGSTIDAVESDGKAGVVWHTQGSGKSMEMELYANLVMRHPSCSTRRSWSITDRSELDGQLFEAFDRQHAAAGEAAPDHANAPSCAMS